MRRTSWAKAFGIALVVVLSAGLMSCGLAVEDEPNADPAPAPVETSTPESTPAPEPVAEPVVIPACEELLSEDLLAEFASSGLVPIIGEDGDRLARTSYEALGPVAQASLERAIQDRRCAWGIPHSDLVVLFIVAELPAETRDHLMSELHASDYIGSSQGNMVTFTYEMPVIGGIWYGFEGDLWVTTLGNSEAGSRVFETLRAANPGLGRPAETDPES